MRILQLCSKVPNPPPDGGAIAMDVLTHGLLDHGAEVKVLAISTYKHPFYADKIPEQYKRKTNIEAVYIDTRIKTADALKNIFSKGSYNITRFFSKEFENKLISVLKEKEYDIVQLEALFVAPYVDTIRKHSKAKIVLRSHNIEYKIWERRAANTRNPLIKAYMKLLAKRLKVYENGMLNKYDGIAAITPEDAKELKASGCVKPVITIPFGINTNLFQKHSDIKEEFPSVFHIGAMNWGPNEDAVKWFLDNVWDKVSALFPDLKFYLAGRNMPDWITTISRKNVVVVGEVANSVDFIRSKGIMIVPLLSGGGMRIKIIEGMAAGKTIISTSIGAEGIPYENGKNILIADTAEDFVNQINTCIKNPDIYLSIGHNAGVLVENNFDNSRICADLLAFYSTLQTSPHKGI